MVFLTSKDVWFLNEQWLIEIGHYFSLSFSVVFTLTIYSIELISNRFWGLMR